MTDRILAALYLIGLTVAVFAGAVLFGALIAVAVKAEGPDARDRLHWEEV